MMACSSNDQLGGTNSGSSGCGEEAADEAASEAAATATSCCCLAAPICLLEETEACNGNNGPNEPECFHNQHQRCAVCYEGLLCQCRVTLLCEQFHCMPINTQRLLQ